MHRPPRARALRLTLSAALLALAAACGSGAVDYGTGVVGGGGGAGQVGGGGAAARSPLVGRWWRYEAFSSGGAARSSETFWDFRADGTATRTLFTTNLTDGLIEVLVWHATWRQVGGEVEVTYTSPFTGTARFLWRIDRGVNAELLYLNDTSFRRLP